MKEVMWGTQTLKLGQDFNKGDAENFLGGESSGKIDPVVRAVCHWPDMFAWSEDWQPQWEAR